MYSYDRRKVASFQDRFKGSFECIVWINDFTIAKDKTITISGTVALLLDGESGGPGSDLKFSNVALKKKGKKWTVVDGAVPVADDLLSKLLNQDSKTVRELDRLQAMK